MALKIPNWVIFTFVLIVIIIIMMMLNKNIEHFGKANGSLCSKDNECNSKYCRKYENKTYNQRLKRTITSIEYKCSSK